MGANRTSFLANRRLQPLGHLSGSLKAIIPECALNRLFLRRIPGEPTDLLYDGSTTLPNSAQVDGWPLNPDPRFQTMTQR
jgi:hypothetical protein